MDISIPPIVRGEFLYRDVLLVDVGGDTKRHARAPEAEIKAILAGKQRDQVGHWFEAQCIHYGIPRSKVKDTCKVRLQQAIGQSKLKTQPPHLSEMEAQMKKEYAAAVRKAKAQAKSQTSSGQGNKRAREDENESASSKKTKISVKVNGVEIEIDQSSSSTTKQKSKAAAEPKKNTKAAATTAETSKKTAPAKATKGTSTTKATPDKTTKNTPAPKGPATSQKAKAAGSSALGSSLANNAHHPDNVFQKPPTAAKTPIKKDPKVKPEPKSTNIRAVKKESKVKAEPGINPASPIKREGYLFDPDAMDTRADMTGHQVSVTGVYDISCVQITEQLPSAADKLRLFVCVDHETGITWGSFNLAMKSGVIKIDDIGVERKLSFGWRSTDSESGSMRFGKGCFGDIAFYGSNQVRGCFYNLFPTLGMSGSFAPAEFEGKRRPGPLWSGRSAPSYRDEWEDFPRKAYGR